MKTVVGLYDTSDAAHAVVRDLTDAGFDRDNISLVANNAAGEYAVEGAGDGDVSAGEGATVGALEGGVLGLLAGLGALLIPGIGPVVAAGPLIGALTGAAAGALTGGLVAALTDLGVPDDHADYYAEGIRRGGTLVTVHADESNVDRAVDIMNRHGAVDVQQRADSWRSEGWSGYDADAEPYDADQISTYRSRLADVDTSVDVDVQRTDATVDRDKMAIPVVEEELHVGKRAVERGGVRVHTRVTDTPVEEQVSLHEESVHVERRTVDRPISDADLSTLKDGTIEVTEMAEEVVVQKEARVVEEVIVEKTATDRVETITDTVRRTDVDVEKIAGEVRVTDEVAYKYGTTLAGSTNYKGRSWEQVEADARRDWERDHGDSPWQDFKSSVRRGWNEVKDAVD